MSRTVPHQETPLSWIFWELLAWLQFGIGLALLFLASYLLKPRDSALGGPGISDEIWFGVPSLLGLIATVFLWKATAPMKRWWLRIPIVSGQLLIGFLLYMTAVIAYLWNYGGTL
jgi:hypothetical protein